ncbi:hypothetical protein ACFL20_06350 [Spirochaetota bacterium]
MSKYRFNELTITIEDNLSEIIMKWNGVSRDKNPATKLVPFFNDFLTTIENKKVKIDLTDVMRVNSSTILPIIYLIQSLEEMQCETQFCIDKNSQWQDAAFKAIEVLVLKYKYFTLNRK